MEEFELTPGQSQQLELCAKFILNHTQNWKKSVSVLELDPELLDNLCQF